MSQAAVFPARSHSLTKEFGSILIVDDDVSVARVLERALIRAGYVVETSHDAKQAIARFGERRFDVVVSDIGMPGMSGLALLRAIRERDLDVPVIMVTGSPDVQSAAEAIEYGAFRYLTKPIDLNEALHVVSRALRLHEMARVRREAVEEQTADGRYLGDKAGVEARFARALSTLWIAYQPIVRWSSRSLFAYEALVRTENPQLANPTDLFHAAERAGRLPELGQTIRRQVATVLTKGQPGTPVFVNIHSSDLADDTLFASESPLSAFASQVVLEITERAALDQVADVMPRMARLRAMGYRIALDDLGAGYAGLASFSQLEPEIVKVDMSIVRGIERSATKQKLLGSVVKLCHDLQIQMVVEGIESEGERDVVLRLGADLCQGYLFSRPGKPFPIPNFDDNVR